MPRPPRTAGRHPRLPAGAGGDSPLCGTVGRIVARHGDRTPLRHVVSRTAAQGHDARFRRPAARGARHARGGDIAYHRGGELCGRLRSVPRLAFRSVERTQPSCDGAGVARYGGAAFGPCRTSRSRSMLQVMVAGGGAPYARVP